MGQSDLALLLLNRALKSPPPPISWPSEPPARWQHDDLGLPTWLSMLPGVQYGPMVMVVPPANPRVASALGVASLRPDLPRAVVAMPSAHPIELSYRELRRLDGSARIPQQRGRPPLRRGRHLEVRWAAWLHDGCQETNRKIADTLVLGGEDDATARRTARSYVGAGRRLLCDWGVIPWVLWENGTLPEGWWTTPRFKAGVAGWYGLFVEPNLRRYEALRSLVGAAAAYGRLA